MNNLKWVCPECGAQHPIDDEGSVTIKPLTSYYNKSACKLCGHITDIHFNNDIDDTNINVLEKMLKDAGKDIEAPRLTYPNLWNVQDVCVYAGPTLPENYWTRTSPAIARTSDSITISYSTDGEDKPKDDHNCGAKIEVELDGGNS